LDNKVSQRTFQHVLDEDTALNDLPVGSETLIVRSNKDNHFADEDEETRQARLQIAERAAKYM